MAPPVGAFGSVAQAQTGAEAILSRIEAAMMTVTNEVADVSVDMVGYRRESA